MYTRSYPSRKKESDSRLPPDYGGTALTVKQGEGDNKRRALTAEPSASREHPHRPVNIAVDKETEPPPFFAPPFGDLGQNGEGVSEDAMTEVQTAEETAEASSRPVIDLSRIRTDDLLLLGLALMFFLDKEKEDGLPLDALMIIAVLFLSGL